MSFGRDIANAYVDELAFRVVVAVGVVLVLVALWRFSPYSLSARVDALEQRVEALEQEGWR